jgi:hypothetical protein
MILLTLVLQFMPAEEARARRGRVRRAARAGERHRDQRPPYPDSAAFTRVRDLWPGELHNHTRAEIASFLDGLQLVPPGLVLARGWRGEMPQADVPPRSQKAYVLGTAVCKP